MNKLYMVGSVFIGIGVLLAYHAGRQDREKELKAEEAKRWDAALHVDETTDDDRTESKTDEYRTLSRIMPSDQAESITKCGWGDYA